MAVTRRLDEQFPLDASDVVAPTMRQILRAIELRFSILEQTKADYEAAVAHLTSLGLARINEILLPASQRILDYSTLGFLLANSTSEVTLAEGAQALFIIDDETQRQLFTPTPFVAIQRNGSPDDYAVAKIDVLHRDTGSLLVTVASVYGNPGPHNDWVITAAPGISEATRSYFEQAFAAKNSARNDAEQVAADRIVVAGALAALQNAGLTPDSYVWRNGTRPFTHVTEGIAPDADAEGAEIAVASWTRARIIEHLPIIASYGSTHSQIIQPILGERRGLVIKGDTFIKLDVPVSPGDYFIWSIAEDKPFPNAESLLDVGSTFEAGCNYYFYLVLGNDNKSATYKISLNTTAPFGATVYNSRKIGGFHTLCVSKGVATTYVRGDQMVDHDLNSWLAGDILPLSVWDLKHRPHEDRTPQPGQWYEKYLGFWLDIYGQSGQGPNTISAYQGTLARTRQYVDHVEDMGCVGKILLSDAEYSMAGLGSPEQVAVAGATEAAATTGGAGGRSASNGHRIISYGGGEEMTGCLWSWLRDPSVGVDPGGAPNAQAGGKGGFWGFVGALLAGGAWSSAAGCGSRARYAATSRAHVSANVGGRGRASPR